MRGKKVRCWRVWIDEQKGEVWFWYNPDSGGTTLFDDFDFSDLVCITIQL